MSRGTHLDGVRPTGKLFLQNRILCGNLKQHRVLELLYCEQCGTVFFGGSRLRNHDGGGIEILSTDPDIEGLPDKQTARFVDRRNYRDFAIFWPNGVSTLNSEAQAWRQPRVVGDRSEPARWAPKYLDAISGRITDAPNGAPPPEGSAIPGHLYVVPAIEGSEQEQDFSALPARCPNCAADYSRRMYRTSPVRGFRTGFSRESALKELFWPPGERHASWSSSDSREDAASISNGIERTHYLILCGRPYDELTACAERKSPLDLRREARLLQPCLRDRQSRMANVSRRSREHRYPLASQTFSGKHRAGETESCEGIGVSGRHLDENGPAACTV